eukprot:10987785-Ditylum_brightwellii.AAC.1
MVNSPKKANQQNNHKQEKKAADRNKTNKDNVDKKLTDTDIPDLKTTPDFYSSDNDDGSDCDPVDPAFVGGIVSSVDGIKDDFERICFRWTMKMKISWVNGSRIVGSL